MENEMKMSNLIIKTVVVLVIISLFITAVFMVFFPKTIADSAKSLGMPKISIAFEKASYEKTEDINSLATIVNYEIYHENNKEIAKYGMEMLMHEHFEEYVQFLGVNSLTKVDYKTFVETYAMQALYCEDMKDEAVAILSSSVESGYEILGSGVVLANDVAKAKDVEFAEKMLDIYKSNFENANDLKKYNIAIEAGIVATGEEKTAWQGIVETLNEKFA